MNFSGRAGLSDYMPPFVAGVLASDMSVSQGAVCCATMQRMPLSEACTPRRHT